MISIELFIGFMVAKIFLIFSDLVIRFFNLLAIVHISGMARISMAAKMARISMVF